MWDYTDEVKRLFLEPKNVGEIPDADAVGEVGSIACGDALRLSLKVDEKGVIEDAKFKTFGCASAIASSSILTEIIKGMTLDEAKNVTNRQLADALGGLPEEKMHCSVMGMEALHAAIANFRGETVEQKEEDEGKLVCQCFGITDAKIKRVALENNLETAEQITHYTKAGGACETCLSAIEDILAEVKTIREQMKKSKAEDPAKEQGPKRLTNLQKINLIQNVIENDVRPMLKNDGGDIDILDIDGNKVYVALRGKCVACRASDVTIKSFVESKLRELVLPDIDVIEVRG